MADGSSSALNKKRENAKETVMIKKASQIIVAALLISVMGDALASSLNIDYSHNVAGTGTIMTNFEMGSPDNTKAIGEVHGTGEILNKYIFSSNSSENITILDQFLFTKAQPSNATTIESYPVMERMPGSFRLLGTSWSGQINAERISSSPRAKDL